MISRYCYGIVIYPAVDLIKLQGMVPYFKVQRSRFRQGPAAAGKSKGRPVRATSIITAQDRAFARHRPHRPRRPARPEFPLVVRAGSGRRPCGAVAVSMHIRRDVHILRSRWEVHVAL